MLSDLLGRMLEWRARSRDAIVRRCGEERQRLGVSVSRLDRLRLRIQEESQRIDLAVFAMSRAMQAALRQGWASTAELTQALLGRNPESQIRRRLAVLPQLVARLRSFMRHHLERQHRQVRSQIAQLHHLSPLAVLGRGYSVLMAGAERHVVRDASRVSVGEVILARLAKGRLQCAVERVWTETDRKSSDDTL